MHTYIHTYFLLVTGRSIHDHVGFEQGVGHNTPSGARGLVPTAATKTRQKYNAWHMSPAIVMHGTRLEFIVADGCFHNAGI